MNSDQFQQFVVEKLLLIESRVTRLETRAALLGMLAGGAMSLLISWGSKHV